MTFIGARSKKPHHLAATMVGTLHMGLGNGASTIGDNNAIEEDSLHINLNYYNPGGLVAKERIKN
jgi:hypothetical protein